MNSVAVEATCKNIEIVCPLTSDLEQYVLDPAIPFDPGQEYDPGQGFIAYCDHLLRPSEFGLDLVFYLPVSIYPTVPSFVEPLRMGGKAAILTVPLSPQLSNLMMGTSLLHLAHPRVLPILPYRLHEEIPAMGFPQIKRNAYDPHSPHQCSHPTGSDPNTMPCTFALWDLASLISQPNHRVQRMSLERKAIIYTQRRVFAVAMPIIPTGAMEYNPGIFMSLPIARFALPQGEVIEEVHREMMGENVNQLEIQ